MRAEPPPGLAVQFTHWRLDFPANLQARNAGPILRLALFNDDSWRRQAPGAFVLKPIEMSADCVEILNNALRLVSFAVAAYLIFVGLLGLNGIYYVVN